MLVGGRRVTLPRIRNHMLTFVESTPPAFRSHFCAQAFFKAQVWVT